MNRIVILLIASFALVNCQSNANTTNSTTTETAPNVTTIATTLTTNQTSEPTAQNQTSTPVATTAPTTASTLTPTTPPKPSEWNGTVTKDNNTCINVKFAVEIKIKYNNTNNTEVTAIFNIPVNARVDENRSSCSNGSQLEVIVIRFDNEEYTSADLTLKFNQTSGNVFVEQIELSYNFTKELFPHYNETGQYNKIVTVRKTGLSLFSVPKGRSAACDKALTASLENGDKGLKTNGAEIAFTESKVQAFIDKTRNGEFDTETNCKSTEISDVVPIAVGAALAGLVVIVLIAYFIGRRRSRRLAYQSV